MDLIGLFKIAGHLGQQLVAGDADVDREAQLAADAVLEPVRGEDGRAVEPLGAGHVDPRLVDGILLDHGRNFAQEGDHLLRGGDVEVVIRLGYDEVGTFVAGHAERLAGLDASFFRRDALGENDAGADVLMPGDDGRDLAQIGLFAEHETAIGCRPRQKRTVDVDVEDHAPGHQ